MKNSNKTEDKIAVLKKNARDYLAEIRRQMLLKFPFSGAISFTMDLIPVRDCRLSTAATDGTSIYFDIEFLNSLKIEEATAVLAHEIWHNVMMHFMRSEARIRDCWNIAADLEVNQILLQEGMMLPADACVPNKFNVPSDLSAEEYYDLLLSKSQSQKKKSASQNSGNSDDSGDDSSSSGSCGNSPNNGGDGRGKTADTHVYSDETADTMQKSTRVDKLGPVGCDPDFNPSVDPKAAQTIRENAVEAAQQLERTRGELPKYLKKLVNKLLKPEVNWKQVLQQFVTKEVGSKNTWSRPNRRFVYNHVYLPAHESESIKVVVGIDTSGSTSSDIPRFLGELSGLVKSFPKYKLTIIQCDTEVKAVDEYTEDCPLDLDNTKFEVSGGGGTILKPVFDHIELNDIDHDVIVMLTDGYTETFTPDMAPEAPVLWMVTKGGCTTSQQFGEVYELEDSGHQTAA